MANLTRTHLLQLTEPLSAFSIEITYDPGSGDLQARSGATVLSVDDQQSMVTSSLSGLTYSFTDTFFSNGCRIFMHDTTYAIFFDEEVNIEDFTVVTIDDNGMSIQQPIEPVNPLTTIDPAVLVEGVLSELSDKE